MKATEVKLLPFLQGTKQFVIPIYQRTYSWKTTQWQQLWNDVRRIAVDEGVSGHFVGSVVYVEKGLYQLSAVPQVLVIDGQQRLTTITLLLAALGKAIEERGGATSTNRKKITNYYLVNGEEEGDLRHKLVLTQSDRETLARIVDGTELPEVASARVVEAYRFFEEQIRKSGVDLDVLFAGISKLIVVDIALDRERDNPQLIFESLNSTGLDLSQADLIRNYVLMGLDTQEQADIYRTHWYPMEQRFGHAEYTALFDRFMRDYLTVKTGRIPNIDAVYTAFKAYVQDTSAGAMREAVAEVARFSTYFVNLALGREPDAEIRGVLDDINTLKVDVAYPFLLEVYDDYARGRVERAGFIAILRLVESYVFRRAICGIPTNSLNKTFATLAGEIDKERYLESARAVFLLKDSYRRFPHDDEFRAELLVKDIYHLRVRNYVLRKLENHGRKERVNVEDFTIEHILPQNEQLNAAWREELGAGWQEIQAKYLHTLGNLTLTAYNSEMSDRPFAEKRTMDGGFADSPIRLNRGLAKLEHWNAAAIEGRAGELVELGCGYGRHRRWMR